MKKIPFYEPDPLKNEWTAGETDGKCGGGMDRSGCDAAGCNK